MRRQEKEILELKRRTETPSSAMEWASDISPFVPKQQKSIVSSLSGQIEMDIEDDLVIYSMLNLLGRGEHT